VIHAPEKIDGKRTQRIEIFYNAVEIINLPTEEEWAAMMEEREALKRRDEQLA
jgi:hypothetical protein